MDGLYLKLGKGYTEKKVTNWRSKYQSNSHKIIMFVLISVYTTFQRFSKPFEFITKVKTIKWFFGAHQVEVRIRRDGIVYYASSKE